MTDAFDPRIVRVTIETSAGLETFDQLSINAVGTKFTNDTLAECDCRIYNLTKDLRDYLLTETSPFNMPNRSAKKMFIDVGRESYGTFRLFEGDVVAGSPTQPPDIGITLKALTGSFLTGVIVSRAGAGFTPLSTIAKQVAADMGKSLDFQVNPDKQISNYAFQGGITKQVRYLSNIGGVNAFVDNDRLVVKDWNKPLANSHRDIDANSGMIGVPVVTERGVYVKMLLDNTVSVGGSITVKSDINPAANGTYTITKLMFEIANRDTPFYYHVNATKYILPATGG